MRRRLDLARYLASLKLEPTAEVYVCLIGDGGASGFPGVILEPGGTPTEPEYHARRFSADAGQQRGPTLIVNGKPHTVPASSGAIGYAITRAGTAHAGGQRNSPRANEWRSTPSVSSNSGAIGGQEGRRGRPRGEIVVTSTEVLTGRVGDRNGPWLADRLEELGVYLAHIAIVGDRREDTCSRRAALHGG